MWEWLWNKTFPYLSKFSCTSWGILTPKMQSVICWPHSNEWADWNHHRAFKQPGCSSWVGPSLNTPTTHQHSVVWKVELWFIKIYRMSQLKRRRNRCFTWLLSLDGIMLAILNDVLIQNRIKLDSGFMWLKQCHKPPMTGNGLYIPPIKMVMTGGWCKWHCFTHIIVIHELGSPLNQWST